MKEFFILIAIGFVISHCLKAYAAVKLLASDPEAWERLQITEDEKRRRRQAAIGRAVAATVNLVSSLFKKEGGG